MTPDDGLVGLVYVDSPDDAAPYFDRSQWSVVEDSDVVTSTTERACPWCGEPITDDDATDWCHRRAWTLHTECHDESECSESRR